MAGEAPTTLLAAAWSADGVQDARLSWTVAPAETTLEPVPSRADDEPPEVGGGDHGFVLRVAPRKGLDLWRHTYYEPHMVKDDASILGLRVAGDFMATVRFTLRAKNQFDQAGVCVRVGPEHWCKAVSPPGRVAAVPRYNASCAQLLSWHLAQQRPRL